jgi:CheY-like chemotaxis protein
VDEHPDELPDEFVELVRDSLLHLYEPSHLQTHALLNAMVDSGSAAATRGRRLYQALLDAIEVLRPAPGTDSQSRAWRAYRILELRYIDGREAASVMNEVALSKNQYHRDHNRALLAVASLLWERWQLAGRWAVAGVPATPRGSASSNLARTELEQLLVGGVGVADPIDMGEVARSVGGLLRALCSSRGVELRVIVADALPPMVGSRVALRQALLSVLTPVIGEAAPGTVEVSVTGRAGRVGVRVVAALDDRHGTGGPRLEHCQPFVDALQGTVSMTTAGQESGLLEVECWFPVSHGTSLLVVDNNPDFIRLIDRYLAGHGWEIVGASDVDQASFLVAQVRPAAILLDLVIPGRDGWEFLVALKEAHHTRDIPVIICSVVREPELALSLGASACLQKPVDQKQLLRVLSQIAASRSDVN